MGWQKKPTVWQYRRRSGVPGGDRSLAVCGALSSLYYMTARDVFNRLEKDGVLMSKTNVSSTLIQLTEKGYVERRVIPGSAADMASKANAAALMAAQPVVEVVPTPVPAQLPLIDWVNAKDYLAQAHEKAYYVEKKLDEALAAPAWVAPTTRGLPVGRKDDSGKPDLASLFKYIPSATIDAVSKVLVDGAKHYGERNWEGNGLSEDRLVGASLRHFHAHQQGQVNDASGSLHLAHAAASTLMALSKRLGACRG